MSNARNPSDWEQSFRLSRGEEEWVNVIAISDAQVPGVTIVRAKDVTPAGDSYECYLWSQTEALGVAIYRSEYSGIDGVRAVSITAFAGNVSATKQYEVSIRLGERFLGVKEL
jgi:hypothetical protein